jgi:hypothetical protein
MKRRALLLGLGLVLMVGLTACVPEKLGGGFIIVNESDQPLFFATARIPPNGGTYKHGIQGCGRPGLELHDSRGDVVVRLEEEFCAGQVWTIFGPDDYTLESAEGGNARGR